MTTVWRLSQAFFGDRMDPGFRGHTSDEARTIFRRMGLTSDFWLGTDDERFDVDF